MRSPWARVLLVAVGISLGVIASQAQAGPNEAFGEDVGQHPPAVNRGDGPAAVNEVQPLSFVVTTTAMQPVSIGSRMNEFDEPSAKGAGALAQATHSNSATLLARLDSSPSLAGAARPVSSLSTNLATDYSDEGPALVPLPASLWGALILIMWLLWLGRQGKRRVRVPI